MIHASDQAWTSVAARARPDRRVGAMDVSGRGRGRVDVAIPDEVVAALHAVGGGSEGTWPVWAAAVCVLHRRLGARGPVCLASPARRAGGSDLTLHVVRVEPTEPFGALVRRLDDRTGALGRDAAESESGGSVGGTQGSSDGAPGSLEVRPSTGAQPASDGTQRSPESMGSPSGGVGVERVALAPPVGPDHDLFDLVLGDVTVHRGQAVPGAATLTIDLDEALLRADPGTGPWDSDALAARAGWLLRIVAQGLATPQIPLSEIGLLSPSESGVGDQYNDTTSETPAPLIGEAVAATIAATPEGLAAEEVASGRAVTYAQLGVAAVRLSEKLVAGGLRRGDVVGIWGPAGAATLAAAVGVWWAAGVVVLLDPAAPTARTRHSASRVSHLITTGDTPWPSERAVFDAPVVDTSVLDASETLATVGKDLGQTPTDDMAGLDASRTPDPSARDHSGPLRAVHPDDVAYVLHTSGSTGVPKGVAVTHRGLAHYLRWAMRAYRVGPGDRVPVASALSFDLTVTALFGPLLTGATVVLPEPGDPISLRGCVQPDARAALVKLTPSHLAALADELPTVAPATDCLVLGGEGLVPGHLRVWQQVATGTRIVNEYGPTETTVAVLAHELDERDLARPAVPIGRPIDDATAYLLDDDLQPVPDGVLGELYIGGAGLARGYLGLPAATAERFLPHPFPSTPGERVYRTGDLAVRDERGDLVFAGRRDRQEKLGGVRIELAEIEAALLGVPGISAAAVTVRRRPDGSATATAHVVCAGDPPSLGQLRRALADRVPRAAVPTSVLVVDGLPLAASGKVDFAALAGSATPAAPHLAPLPATHAEAPMGVPRGPVEALLTDIWAELLGSAPGRDDDFFALGGDSILAVRIVARAREAGLVLRPSQVFELGTIARLAEVAQPVPEEPGADTAPGPVPLTTTQRWFLAASGPADGYAQFREFRLAAPRAPEDVVAAVRGLVARHDALRLRVRPRDHTWEQVLAPAGHAEPAVTLLALHGSPADEPAWRRGCAQAIGSTRAAGPMVACAVGVADGSVQRLLVAVHHLAVDHLSWLFLVDDLEQALAGRLTTEPAASFAAWARRGAITVGARRGQAAGPGASRAGSESSGGAGLAGDSLESVPTSAPPARPQGVPRRATAELPPGQWGALLTAAREAYNADPLDALCTAVVLALDPADRHDALAVETSGRDGDGTAGAVGWFTRISAVPVPDPTGDPATLLARMKDAIRRTAHGSASDSPPGPAAPEPGRFDPDPLSPRAERRGARYPDPIDADALGASPPGAVGPRPRVGVTHLGSVTPDGSATPKPGQVLIPHAQASFLADAPGLPTPVTVTGAEVSGRLVVEIVTASAELPAARFAERIVAELDALGAALAKVQGPGATPADFRRVDLDDDELAAILAGLQESG